MAEVTETQENASEQSLENFDWDATGTEDFFGIKGTAPDPTDVDEVVEEVKKEDEVPVDTEEPETEDEPEDVSFFDIEDEDPTDPNDEEEDKGNGTESEYVSLVSQMKDKGIFQNIDIPEDEEVTEEKFFEYHDQEVEARVDEALEGLFEGMDEDAAAFIKYKKEGGDTKSFFEVYKKSNSLPEGDLTEESYQEKISRYYFKNVEELDEEDINDKIEWLKDSGKLEKYSQKYDTKVKEISKKEQEDLQKRVKEQTKAQEKARQEFVDSVQKTLEETDEVNNFKFTPKDKKELKAFITKPSVKVGKNQFMTGMQSKLQEAVKDPQKMILLAKLLKNDFDISDVVTKEITRETKKSKEDIRRSKTVTPKSSGKTRKTRNLADFFN